MMPPQEKELYANVLNKLSKELHETSKSKGFWPDDEENFKEDLNKLFIERGLYNTPLSFSDSLEGLSDSLEGLSDKILELAKKHKAWDKEKMIAQKLLLEISEIAEAYEGLRKGNPPDDHIPSKPTFDIEMADSAIRHLDLCSHLGINIGEAVKLKSEYNKSRPHLHGKAF